MTSRPVIFSLRAGRQLAELLHYIERESGAERANTFVESIVAYCRGLSTFPERGTRRDDLVSGLRVIGYRRRVTIAFTIEQAGVVIQGIFYGGQDYEAALSDEGGE